MVSFVLVSYLFHQGRIFSSSTWRQVMRAGTLLTGAEGFAVQAHRSKESIARIGRQLTRGRKGRRTASCVSVLAQWASPRAGQPLAYAPLLSKTTQIRARIPRPSAFLHRFQLASAQITPVSRLACYLWVAAGCAAAADRQGRDREWLVFASASPV